MKRQADGVSPNEEVEVTEANGTKRIKLLNNDAKTGSSQENSPEEILAMDVPLNESFHNHNHENHSTSNNGSSCELDDATYEKVNAESCVIQNLNESGPTENSNLNHLTNNCKSSDVVVENSATDSGITPELHHSNSHENSGMCPDNYTKPKDAEPPVLNHCDHDLQNGESTDSFQSEGFEALNCREESKKEVSENHTSQEQNSDHEKDFSFESKQNNIDVDNLTLSHLNVTELQGHTDEIFSVAADDDFILSSSADTTVKVWNMERLSNVSTFSGHSGSVTALLLLNPNQSKALKKKMSLTKVSRIAITGSLDCHIKLWSVLEGKELASIYTFNGITCLGYLESDCLVVVGTEGGKLELWNLSSAKAIISVHAHEDAVTDIKVIDNYIYSVSIAGTVKVWSFEDDDIYPVYTRKRKEVSSDKTGFKPTHWNTVAVENNVMYLGDNTNSIKVLDWRAGRLSLFKNQIEDEGISDCVMVLGNMLFSTCYDSSTDTGSVNVWKLPEMAYVCTLMGALPHIKSLAVVLKNNKLKIVTGGYKLFISEFDFSKPPRPDGEFYVRELEMLGQEINEKSVEIKKYENDATNPATTNVSSSSNKWCNIM